MIAFLPMLQISHSALVFSCFAVHLVQLVGPSHPSYQWAALKDFDHLTMTIYKIIILTVIVIITIITMIMMVITEVRPWSPVSLCGLTACKANPLWTMGNWFYIHPWKYICTSERYLPTPENIFGPLKDLYAPLRFFKVFSCLGGSSERSEMSAEETKPDARVFLKIIERSLLRQVFIWGLEWPKEK